MDNLIYTSQVTEVLSQANMVILGKEHEVRLAFCCVLAGGHLLLEDRPGVGKTTLVNLFARLLGMDLKRVQCTSDLLPADILGVSIFNEATQDFTFHPGPVFAQLVMADELNRASPKTQSAFLQAMEERHVTVDGKTYSLPAPFTVIATQNPGGGIGTFDLPASQLDRFLMRIRLGFPGRDAEKALLLGERRAVLLETLAPVLAAEGVILIQNAIKDVHVSETLAEYVLALVQASRDQAAGLSPRAAMDILQAARSWAFLDGRNFVIPEDVQAVAVATMGHRLLENSLTQEGDALARHLLQTVAIP